MRDISEGIINRTQVDKYCTGGGGGGKGVCARKESKISKSWVFSKKDGASGTHRSGRRKSFEKGCQHPCEMHQEPSVSRTSYKNIYELLETDQILLGDAVGM